MKVLILGNEKIVSLDQKNIEIESIHEPSLKIIAEKLISNSYELIISNYNKDNKDWQTIQMYIKYNYVDVAISTLDNFLETIDKYDENFKEIDILAILKHDILPADIYLSLSSEKFIKIINANELFSHSLLENLLSKNVKQLFVLNSNFAELTKYLLKHIDDNEQKIKTIPDDQKITLHIDKIVILQNLVRTLQLNEQTITLLNDTANKAIETISQDSHLKKFLQVYSQSDKYLTNHSIMISHIACLVAVSMGWNTNTTLQKLSIAAILHDVTFTDEKLARVKTMEEAEQKFPKFLYGYKMHPIHIAKMIEQSKNLPPHIDKIVLSHHENPEGTGFPKGLSAQAPTQLECLFIIAHDFVDRIYDKEITVDLIAETVYALEERYFKGNYKTPMVGMSKLLYSMKLI